MRTGLSFEDKTPEKSLPSRKRDNVQSYNGGQVQEWWKQAGREKVESIHVSSSILQRFRSPAKSQRDSKSRKVISASATSLLHWKTLLSTERKEKSIKFSQKKISQTPKPANQKKQSSKSRIRDTSNSKIDKGVNRNTSKVFWDLLESVKSKQKSRLGQPLMMSSRSLKGLNVMPKTCLTTREGRFPDKIIKKSRKSSSIRGDTNRTPHKLSSSILWSPKLRKEKSHLRLDNPGSSALSSRIHEILQRHTTSKGIKSSRIENSHYSIANIDDRFKQKNSKLSTSSKLSLLGMKVDKLIKAVQDTNTGADRHASSNYLVFDRSPSRHNRPSSIKNMKKCRISAVSNKECITVSDADCNRCMPVPTPVMVFRCPRRSVKSSKMHISSKFMPKSMCLSKDIVHLPEMQAFMRYPDRPDSMPMFGILHAMMPANDSHRPVAIDVGLSTIESIMATNVQPHDIEHIDCPSRYVANIKTANAKMNWHASHKANMIADVDNCHADMPNTNANIVYDGYSVVDKSIKLSQGKEVISEKAASDTFNVDSDNTRVLSPFQSPIGQMPDARKKLLALRSKHQGQSQTPVYESSSRPYGTIDDTSRLPAHMPICELSLRQTIAAKKALMMPYQTNIEHRHQPKSRDTGMIKSMEDVCHADDHTPEFIASPKHALVGQSLLDSLSHLKSTISSKTALN